MRYEDLILFLHKFYEILVFYCKSMMCKSLLLFSASLTADLVPEEL